MANLNLETQKVVGICTDYEATKGFLSQFTSDDLKTMNDILLIAMSRVNAEYRRKVGSKEPMRYKKRKKVKEETPEIVGENDLIF